MSYMGNFGVSWEDERDAVEEFMLFETDFVERLKAHYRQGYIVKGEWVNVKEVILDKEDELSQQYHRSLLSHKKQVEKDGEEIEGEFILP